MGIKLILKIILAPFVGFFIYFILFNGLYFFFDEKIKHDVAWGLSVHYGYYFFAILLFVSSLACSIKDARIYSGIVFLSLSIFIGYWFPVHDHFPNRVLAIIFLGCSVYCLLHLYLILFVRSHKSIWNELED